MSGVLLITGGSRGIGAATAVLAASRGYAVAVNYLRARERAEAVVEEARRAGARAMAIAADVSVQAEVERLFLTVDAELGRLTVLVNNAGIVAPPSRVEDIDAVRLTRLLSTNVVGSFLCAREAIRRLSTRHGGQGGAIVNVSSVASRLGSAGEYVDYAASKAAIDTFTIGLSREVAGEGIRVNAVRPGIIATEIHAPGRLARLEPTQPMGRVGTAEEVAEAILWLASEHASYCTGALLDVAGGR